MERIFSITPPGSFDLGAVIKSSYRYLDGTVVVLQEAGCTYDSSRLQSSQRDDFGTCLGYAKPFGALFRISLRQGPIGIFRVIPRPSTPTDFEAVKAAANDSGQLELGEIAVRCQTVWEVTADVAPEFNLPLPPAATLVLSMCAVLAEPARGPILLEDGALLSAKGAWERLQQLLKPAA